LTPAFSSSALFMGARRRVALALIPLALLWLGVLWAAFGGRAPQSARACAFQLEA
jgi:hypothetical protein